MDTKERGTRDEPSSIIVLAKKTPRHAYNSAQGDPVSRVRLVLHTCVKIVCVCVVKITAANPISRFIGPRNVTYDVLIHYGLGAFSEEKAMKRLYNSIRQQE